MGLIKAFTGSVLSYIGDVWEDYIYCDSLDNDTLVKRGHKKSSPGAGNQGDDNVITEGSRIAVNAGQMLIVVENGRIIDFTAEQGGYEFQSKTEPSAFCGDLKEALKISAEEVAKRFQFGGIPSNDQRAYFVNTKEIMNNRFGFGNVPYRDSEFNLTILLQGFGNYSYRITDPIKFYENVCGNVAEQFDKKTIVPQLRTELQNTLLPVLGELANRGIRYDQISMQTDTIVELLQERLSKKWKDERGIEIMTMALGNILPDDESIDKLRDLQESRAYSDNRAMLGARVGAASANAMESAAENPSGAVNGFMGMGMARGAANIDVAELMRDNPAQAQQIQSQSTQSQQTMAQQTQSQSSLDKENEWVCSCGMVNYMMFCPKCGSKKPEPKTCPSCGFVFPKELAGMKFCPSCGTKVEE